MVNKYLITSIILLSAFVILSVIVSPKVNLGIKNSIVGIDNTLFLKINNSHYPAINQFMIYLTQYGREVFWTLTIGFLFIFGGKAGKKTAIVMAVSMVVLILLGSVAKDIIERPRPMIPVADRLITADTEFAFPSGHAVIVSAGAAVALVLFRGSFKKLALSILLTSEAVLVCISRVYIGGHYPLDVIGGIFLGVGISFLFLWKEKEIELLYSQFGKLFKKRPT